MLKNMIYVKLNDIKLVGLKFRSNFNYLLEILAFASFEC